ncbi:hypothetical protein [Leucobacter chromiiresistens]|uniref:Uncharacterized protein n=1 Tax=Leucobacter chromiiresistens TaxID=1079994 RepID=A0A1H0XQK5_9MICO|nr:hypothetical protein [Leucobacter chromiiresistens]SDQ05061.1 hypothetical protein SAMN04488565_0040 [Leucobacter chromiiresistens]SDQ47720.1 hypothetical protein SAMN04488565_2625 [Leucobacter chromiiresistens]
MSRELAVIVHAAEAQTPFGDIPFGYEARVVDGTIERYNPRSIVDLWRPTAAWAKAAGDAWIRRARRREERTRRREQRARRATGYEEKSHAD